MDEVAAEVAAEEVVAEVAEEPPTPSPKPKKKVEMATRPVPTLDADFWGGMLNTKRAMDKAATSLRYSKLVVLK
jgi:hypothetical protein